MIKDLNTLGLVLCDEHELPFYSDDTIVPTDGIYAIYHDGSHYVGRKIRKSSFERKLIHNDKSRYSSCFNEIYALEKTAAHNTAGFANRIKKHMQDCFNGDINAVKYAEERLANIRHNAYNRRKRFRRKAYLNDWNYFVTLTFNDELLNAEQFKQKVRKCLSNFHTRRNWRYMGVFEHSPEKNRLHFHAIMYIPEDEMPGEICEKKSYSPISGRVESRHENSFFAKRFGINDFAAIQPETLKYDGLINYILKYLEKQGERIIYSRGIPSEICKELTCEDIIAGYFDYVTKFVLVDRVIDFKRDILHSRYRQMSLFDSLSSG